MCGLLFLVKMVIPTPLVVVPVLEVVLAVLLILIPVTIPVPWGGLCVQLRICLVAILAIVLLILALVLLSLMIFACPRVVAVTKSVKMFLGG